jgi:small multidrug resistance family-3 protein
MPSPPLQKLPAALPSGHGGVYIAASLIWLWLAEGVRPDRWDLAGMTVALIGSAIILAGPR